MIKILKIVGIMAVFSLYGCSSNQKDSGGEEKFDEMAENKSDFEDDGKEMVEDDLESGSLFGEAAENYDQDKVESDKDLDDEFGMSNETDTYSSSSKMTNYAGSGVKKIKVEKNETLMMIAYKIYGDYSKWKLIAELNSGVIGQN